MMEKRGVISPQDTNPEDPDHKPCCGGACQAEKKAELEKLSQDVRGRLSDKQAKKRQQAEEPEEPTAS